MGFVKADTARGIASPLLANLTLDGLEQTIRASINTRRDKVNFVRTYPVGKIRAFSASKDRIATRNPTENKPDCRITSAEADLRKA
jgi:hypothetical protein